MQLFNVEDRALGRSEMAIRVNGQEIPGETITREIQNHPAETVSEAREAAVRALVVRELLLQEAHRRGLRANVKDLGSGKRETEDDALIRELLDDVLALPEPTEQECRRFYDHNMDRFAGPTIWEPAHILVACDTSDPEARAAARRFALEITEAVRAQPDRFEDLARTHSACPSGEHGGNLGQVTKGQTTPEFEMALKQMQPGSITDGPVETPYGFHIIRLERRMDGQTLPFETVRGKIGDYLADAVFHKAVHQYVTLLAGQADIEGIDIQRATSPLVQ